MFKKFFTTSAKQDAFPEPVYEVVQEPEDDNEQENTDDLATDVFSSPIATQTWGTRTVSYHFKSVRDVAPYLSSWCFNRTLDQVHKNRIKDDLLQQTHPHLMGTIQVVRDLKHNCRVVNGQHRIKAIEEIIREDVDMTFQMNMMFEVYDLPLEDIDDIDDDNHHDIEKLFMTANASLNFRPDDDHDLFCKKIVMAMLQDPLLKKGLVDKTTGTVLRPRLLVKELYENFKKHLPPNHKMTIEGIITRVKQINVQLSTMPNIKLFGRNNPAEAKLRQREKAKELGFYLNLNSRYPPEIWIQMIPALT